MTIKQIASIRKSGFPKYLDHISVLEERLASANGTEKKIVEETIRFAKLKADLIGVLDRLEVDLRASYRIRKEMLDISHVLFNHYETTQHGGMEAVYWYSVPHELSPEAEESMEAEFKERSAYEAGLTDADIKWKSKYARLKKKLEKATKAADTKFQATVADRVREGKAKSA